MTLGTKSQSKYFDSYSYFDCNQNSQSDITEKADLIQNRVMLIGYDVPATQMPKQAKAIVFITTFFPLFR